MTGPAWATVVLAVLLPAAYAFGVRVERMRWQDRERRRYVR